MIINDHSGYQQCALLMLRKGLNVHLDDNDKSAIQRCIDDAFDGSEAEFIEWADYFLSEGMGISG